MRPLVFLLLAAFVSGLADNALLLVAIARLQATGEPAWMLPLLKVMFTLAYVLLAPLVGTLADRCPKGRVMAAANAVKAAACLALLAGCPALAGFALAGAGAAVYSPAKYGLVTELVPARRLVVANGWLEVSTVLAILLGLVAGGWLTSPHWGALVQTSLGGASGLGQGDTALDTALAAVLLLYALAALFNRGVPDSGARYPQAAHGHEPLRAFAAAQRTLWRDPTGAASLATTTLFWGVGALLQFLVLRWAGEQLGLTLSQAAYLQGVAGIGVVAGSLLAGAWVPIERAVRVLPLGILMGLLMPLMLAVETPTQGAMLLALVGALGGLFVVPMNALLQQRGSALLSAGRSIAVQNFCENASVLVLLLAYAAGAAQALSLAELVWGCGLAIAGLMALLTWHCRALLRWPRPVAPSPITLLREDPP